MTIPRKILLLILFLLTFRYVMGHGFIDNHMKVDDRCLADIFVVSAVASLGQRTGWASLLRGGLAIDAIGMWI